MDPRKALREDDSRTEIARLQSSVFAGAAFAVVGFGNDEPFFALGFPFLGEVWDAAFGRVVGRGFIEVVVGGVCFAGFGVDGADEGVGADVGEVAFVF